MRERAVPVRQCSLRAQCACMTRGCKVSRGCTALHRVASRRVEDQWSTAVTAPSGGRCGSRRRVRGSTPARVAAVHRSIMAAALARSLQRPSGSALYDAPAPVGLACSPFAPRTSGGGGGGAAMAADRAPRSTARWRRPWPRRRPSPARLFLVCPPLARPLTHSPVDRGS